MYTMSIIWQICCADAFQVWSFVTNCRFSPCCIINSDLEREAGKSAYKLFKFKLIIFYICQSLCSNQNLNADPNGNQEVNFYLLDPMETVQWYKAKAQNSWRFYAQSEPGRDLVLKPEQHAHSGWTALSLRLQTVQCAQLINTISKEGLWYLSCPI